MTRDRGHVLNASRAWELLLGVRTLRDADAAGLVRETDETGRAGVTGVTGASHAAGDAAAARGVWRWRQEAEPEAARLAELYTPLCLAGPRVVFAQLGQSVDGFIATRTGDAVYVTGEADRLHLHRLRALADAVVVGAGTAIADDPRLTVRACAGPNPVRVILDRRGRVRERRRVFTDGDAPTLWVLGVAGRSAARTTDGVDVLRVPSDGDGFAPERVLDALARRGLGRVFVEGGGVTVSRFLHAGALHRLYVTVAPVIVGDGVPGLRFPGPDRMRDALRAPVRRFTLGDDALFEFDLGTRASACAVAAERTEHRYDGAGQA